MLVSFLDKLGGLFERRFILAYWMPVFIWLGAVAGLVAGYWGLKISLSWWMGLHVTAQVVLGAVLLFAVAVLAYLLQALTEPIVRFYEGYGWPNWLRDWVGSSQKRYLDGLKRAGDSRYRERYLYFPRDETLLQPTQLGNVFRAAEEYSLQVYGLDAVIWWPRLTAVLPEAFRGQVDAALTPMLALLNLSVLFSLVAMFAGLVLIAPNRHPGLFLLAFVGGVLLAWFAYRAAVREALNYGSLIRVGFDLYRHKILKQMRVPVPDDSAKEDSLWRSLYYWVYWYAPPGETEVPPDPAPIPNPFKYDNSGEPPPLTVRVQMDRDG